MKQKDSLQFNLDVFLYPLLFVLTIWIVFWAELKFGFKLTRWGVYPHRIEGLKGIVLSPLVHGSLKHLFNNTIPLFVLSSALFYFYRSIRWKVLLLGIVLTGFGTWLFARPAWHIGASGIIYLLASFLFFKGVFSKIYQLIALSLLVVFLYGSLVWYLFNIDPKISWEGHLSGFIVGFLFALIFRKNPIEKLVYEWEKPDFDPKEDEFLKHFDDDGNFIETLPEQQHADLEETLPRRIKIVYHHKTNSNRNASEEE